MICRNSMVSKCWNPPYLQFAMKVRIRVTPNASRSEVIGWEGDPAAGRILRVRVAAPPVEGKANEELRGLLARSFGVPKSQVTLDKGGTGRVKTFIVPDSARLPE